MVDFGVSVAQTVLYVASLLKEETAPGWAVVGLLFALIAFLGHHYWKYRRPVIRAIRFAKSILSETASDPEGFQKDFFKASGAFTALWRGENPGSEDSSEQRPDDANSSRQRKVGNYEKKIGIAWREFRESLVLLPEMSEDPAVSDKKRQIVKNTVRPSLFFNREDLLMDDPGYRYVPTFFVSVGLFLTFLGLIAALGSAGDTLSAATEGGDTLSALTELLSVASAKFIMSLTGLAASIIFTIRQRTTSSRIDAELHELCDQIEQRIIYQTPERLLVDLIESSQEQKEQLKTFSKDLAAQLGQTIIDTGQVQAERLEGVGENLVSGFEALQSTITKAVPEAMADTVAPLIQQVEQSRKDSANDLADNVGAHLTAGIQNAMEEMKTSLGNVADSLSGVAGRMDTSAGNMSSQMEHAVQALASEIGNLRAGMQESAGTAVNTLNEGAEKLLQNMEESLSAIRQNTSDSAEALSGSIRAISEATEALSQQIEAAGQQATAIAGQQVAQAGQAAKDGIAGAGMEVVGAMSGAMERLNEQAGAFAETFETDLLSPLSNVRSELTRLGDGVSRSTVQIGKYTDAVGDSAAAVETVNMEVGHMTRALSSAAEPLGAAASNIAQSHQEMRRTVEETARTMQEGVARTNNAAVGAIQAALDGINAQRSVVSESTDAVKAAVTEFSRIVEQYEKIDRALGHAFEQIDGSVSKSISEIDAFAKQLNDQSASALNTMREVLDQVEEYLGPGRS